FSFGVLLWELFAAAKPHGNLQAAQVPLAVVMRNARPSPDPASLPAALTDLMKRCWAADPQQRPAMAHVVASVGQELQRADAAAQAQAAARHECVLCLDAQRSTAFVPCGHVCCCADCAEDVAQCPVCRGAVQERLKVFHV
ncbi:MAG: protein kinase, partial [Myxococcales bacterium]|nr:protein kinase [Myxococcales bacterium]